MRHNRSAAALAAAAFLLASGACLTLAAPAHAGTPGGTYANDRNSDFDGDGREDVVTAAPTATVAGARGAGHVSVRYGSDRGPGAERAVRISQATAEVPGAPEADDGFGTALATGDLNSDGYDELIVGVPGEDLAGHRSAGGVTVLWGGKKGLSTSGSWLRARHPAENAHFGAALAAARFSAAHPGDLLAVADRHGLELAEWAPVPPPVDGGGPGGPPGGIAPLDTTPHDTTPDGTTAHDTTPDGTGAARSHTPARPLARTALPRPAGARATVVRTLTTGDYNSDGLADLIASGTSTGADGGAGWSAYLPGGARGPAYARDLVGGPVAASGDIDGDGYDDLVTGEPAASDAASDSGGATPAGGLVGVRYGGPSGPAAEPQWWTQDSPGVAGTPEHGDGFGSDLSVADADGDGYAEVAIGAAGEDVGRVADAGAVWVLKGSPTGLTGRGSTHWNQGSPQVPGAVERGDSWGAQVRFTGPDAQGRYALLAAAHREDDGTGSVWLLPAGRDGVGAAGSSTFGAGRPHGGAGHFGAVIDE
ncbi:FG-GAP repeat protein [Streptomyces sp. NPDC058171]